MRFKEFLLEGQRERQYGWLGTSNNSEDVRVALVNLGKKLKHLVLQCPDLRFYNEESGDDEDLEFHKGILHPGLGRHGNYYSKSIYFDSLPHGELKFSDLYDGDDGDDLDRPDPRAKKRMIAINRAIGIVKTLLKEPGPVKLTHVDYYKVDPSNPEEVLWQEVSASQVDKIRTDISPQSGRLGLTFMVERTNESVHLLESKIDWEAIISQVKKRVGDPSRKGYTYYFAAALLAEAKLHHRNAWIITDGKTAAVYDERMRVSVDEYGVHPQSTALSGKTIKTWNTIDGMFRQLKRERKITGK